MESVPLWVAQTNAYVIGRGRDGPAVLVDAPPDVEGIGALLAAHGLVPVALLVTHGHVDHVGGAGSVARRFALRAFAHPADEFLTLDPSSQLRMLFGMVPPGDYEPPERWEALADGAELDLAGVGFQVRHTPGHTPGHCCFHVPEEALLFSGDQLFAGSIGRTDLPGGDFGRLMASMRDRVLDLADDTRVLPGHGPETTIGRERRLNPFRFEWESRGEQLPG